MAYLLEKYIAKSKKLKSVNAALKSPSMDTHSIYERIVTLKGLNTTSTLHSTYVAPNLAKALKMIKSYNAIVRDMEESVIPFDQKNKNHQELLFSFWKAMDPLTLHSSLSHPIQEIEFEHNNTDKSNYVPSLESKAWEFVGFQGEKPWTDFRAVGLFGLRQLKYFGTAFPAQSREILSYCMQFGQLKCFSYAITGINLSYDVMTWFRLRKANLYYYNYLYDVHSETNELNAVHSLYCKSFVEFQKIWKADPPKTVMGYSEVHKSFLEKMEAILRKGIKITYQP